MLCAHRSSCALQKTPIIIIRYHIHLSARRRIRRSRIAKSVATVTDDNNTVVASISYSFYCYTDAIRRFFWPSSGGICAPIVAVPYTDKNLKPVWRAGSGQDRDYRLLEMRSVDGIATKRLRSTADEKNKRLYDYGGEIQHETLSP